MWSITQFLKFYCGRKDKDWDTKLQILALSYNASRNELTGFSPIHLILEEKPNIPSKFPPRDQAKTYQSYAEQLAKDIYGIRLLASLNTIQTKFRNKLYYDKRTNTTNFREGEIVYLINEANSPKISKDAFIGPFEITCLCNNSHTVEIQT